MQFVIVNSASVSKSVYGPNLAQCEAHYIHLDLRRHLGPQSDSIHGNDLEVACRVCRESRSDNLFDCQVFWWYFDDILWSHVAVQATVQTLQIL